VGPRQVGKTTLARTFLPVDSPAYFDLEDAIDQVRLSEPRTALAPFDGLVVIDEVQRTPEIFSALRVLVDRDPLQPRFLVLGSASPSLLRQSSESLAGRIEVIEVPPFTFAEVEQSEDSSRLNRLWWRGGFPRSFLAATDEDSRVWRAQFVRTFLERDLPALALAAPPETVRRFWAMLAHLHGQTWNAAVPARSLGIGETTVRRYLDALAGTYMVRVLPAWHVNLGKRQVKAPKVYFRDSGLLHTLLGVRDLDQLWSHPRLGASWEGLAIELLLRRHRPEDAYFWATHAGAELDLLMIAEGRKLGFEFKRADAPTMTRSMHIALRDLSLDKLTVVYPGTRRYPLQDSVEVVPLRELV